MLQLCASARQLSYIIVGALSQWNIWDIYKGAPLLTGRIVLITGAAAGIGRHLALCFAGAQATVIAVDIDQTALDALVDEAAKFGLDVAGERCDVTELGALKAVRDRALHERKRIDIWVNNAGVAGTGAFADVSAEQFDRVLDINLKALVYGTRLALEAMEAQGMGRIVNMASVAGHLPAPYMTAYNASKFGVVGFSRALQAELRLRDSPVSITLVSPGFVDTDIIGRGTETGFPEWLSFLLAKPENVAKEIVAAVEAGKDEIFPTLNGKLMRGMYKIMPNTTVRSAKVLLAKSWKDVFLNRITLEGRGRKGSESDPNS